MLLQQGAVQGTHNHCLRVLRMVCGANSRSLTVETYGSLIDWAAMPAMITWKPVDDDRDREAVVDLPPNVDCINPWDQVHHCCCNPPQQVWRPLRILHCGLCASRRC